MSQAGTLLVEARVEEMPPQLLRGLANQFPQNLEANLRKAGFADDESFREKNADGNPKTLATPRRLVALLKNIRRVAPDRMLIRRGPQVAAALDKDGRPTKALEGFLRATGKTVGDLRKTTERGKEYFAADLRESGGTLDDKLAAIVQETLLSLNAPRLMRWGSHDWRFVRPLRGMVMLWENDAIGGEVMGVKAGRTTLGHRFMSEGKVDIPSAAAYEDAMEAAKVIVDCGAREKKIWDALKEVAKKNGGKLADVQGELSWENGALANNIAAICEFPRAHCGDIRPEFMSIPDFCFDLCLRKHQWCFPMAGIDGKRIPKFLFVADNAPEYPLEMIRGFERVLSARLADVAFYLREDRKASWEDNREKLKSIVYHEKLGSQFDRAERIYGLTGRFASMMGLQAGERQDAINAAYIFLADLPTLIVGEYPEIAGCFAAEYYAEKHSNVWRILYQVVMCQKEEWWSGSSGADCLLLAVHMEKMAGMFAAGETPTGSKDPHGLRASASLVADRLMERDVDLHALIKESLSLFSPTGQNCGDEIYDFIVERTRWHFEMATFDVDDHLKNPNMENLNENIVGVEPPTEKQLEVEKLTVDAVLCQRPSRLLGLKEKIQALQQFTYDSRYALRARTIIAANKRVNNIFRKSGVSPESLPTPDDSLFEHDEERKLFRAMEEAKEKSGRHIANANNSDDAQGCYREALESLLVVAAPVDAFFDRVMVNAEDEKIRANRFALLAELRALLNQVADISKLSG